MTRCTVCGRSSQESHCTRCHANHDRLQEQPIWAMHGGHQIVQAARRRGDPGMITNENEIRDELPALWH